MSVLQAIILGLIQGFTEFIPVSSSGHLVLAHHFFGVTEMGLSFDVALHMGTLLSLLVFFRKDLLNLAQAVIRKQPERKLVWFLALATIPAVITGMLLESAAESAFRSPRMVAINLAIVAVLMLFAERFYHTHVKKPTKLQDVSLKQALIMGGAQAAAVIPGVSRSGSTITAGLFAGMNRVAATRFSFLLGIPIIFGAVIKVFTEPEAMNQLQDEKTIFAIGIITAFISGLFAIRFMLGFLAKHSLAIFAYYRIILSIIVLLVLALA